MYILPEHPNIIKLSGFYLSEEAAQKALDSILSNESKNSHIINAKKELLQKKKNAYFLYKFTIVTAPKNNY